MRQYRPAAAYPAPMTRFGPTPRRRSDCGPRRHNEAVRGSRDAKASADRTARRCRGRGRVGVIAATRSHGSKTPSTALTASKIPARPATPVRGPKVIVQSAAVGPAIAPGFVGLTMEYRNLEELVGSDPTRARPGVPPAAAPARSRPAPGSAIRRRQHRLDLVAGRTHAQAARRQVFADSRLAASCRRAQLAARHAHLILGINLEADNRVVRQGRDPSPDRPARSQID